MPISYAERRQRRRQLSAQLPPSLRAKIALRNVEAVARLSPEAQQVLSIALDGGVRVSAAIQFLKGNPQASLDEVLQACQRQGLGKRESAATASTPGGSAALPDARDLAALASLLQACFPDMPQITAAAMARSALLSEVLELLRVQRECFESRHIESDFILVVLCGLVVTTVKRLNERLSKKPAYRQALLQSGVSWAWFDGSEGLSDRQPAPRPDPNC